MGQWKFNAMHGYGEFHWKDGKKYAGIVTFKSNSNYIKYSYFLYSPFYYI